MATKKEKAATTTNTKIAPIVEAEVITETIPVVEEPIVETMEEVVGEAAIPEKPEMVLLSTGIWTAAPTATINCCECGAERVIKTSDLFQVTRCAPCQKKEQNRKRAAKMKERNRQASLERRLEEARKLIAEHDSQKANEE